MELSTALLGLLPGALVPDEGSTAGLLALLKELHGFSRATPAPGTLRSAGLGELGHGHRATGDRARA